MHAVLASVAYLLLPADRVVVGVSAGLMLSYASGCLIAGVVLGRRLRGIEGSAITGLLARLYLASTPMIAAGMLAAWSSSDRGAVISFAAIACACLFSLPVAYLAIRAMGVRDADPALLSAWSRLRGGR
ncbi:hypothetical protein [Nonomuraea sp. NPDC003201]